MEVTSISGKIVKIDILDITDVEKCTGLEPEFREADLQTDPREYRYCILIIEEDGKSKRIPVLDDFRTFWYKIKEEMRDLNISKVH